MVSVRTRQNTVLCEALPLLVDAIKRYQSFEKVYMMLPWIGQRFVEEVIEVLEYLPRERNTEFMPYLLDALVHLERERDERSGEIALKLVSVLLALVFEPEEDFQHDRVFTELSEVEKQLVNVIATTSVIWQQDDDLGKMIIYQVVNKEKRWFKEVYEFMLDDLLMLGLPCTQRELRVFCGMATEGEQTIEYTQELGKNATVFNEDGSVRSKKRFLC